MTPEYIRQVLDSADRLYSNEQVHAALDDMAKRVNNDYKEKVPVFCCVMNGGMVLAGNLMPRLNILMEVDYVHATRYRGATKGGEEVHWLAEPQSAIKGRDVIVVDDILDEGITLSEICTYFEEQGAASIKTLLLVEKRHGRRVVGARADYSALSVPDRYVFGFGMDFKGFHRNAPGIYAVSEKLMN